MNGNQRHRVIAKQCISKSVPVVLAPAGCVKRGSPPHVREQSLCSVARYFAKAVSVEPGIQLY